MNFFYILFKQMSSNDSYEDDDLTLDDFIVVDEVLSPPETTPLPSEDSKEPSPVSENEPEKATPEQTEVSQEPKTSNPEVDATPQIPDHACVDIVSEKEQDETIPLSSEEPTPVVSENESEKETQEVIVEESNEINSSSQPSDSQEPTPVVSENEPVNPLVVDFKNLADTLQGRLIQISAVEFSAADTGRTYADKKNKLGLSRSLKFCSGGTIYMRTSGYADFAGVKIPSGNGIVIGVYSVYNNEKQIILRDTNDILLTAKRCTGAAWLQNLPQTAPKSPN
jgi:hypothetical protein